MKIVAIGDPHGDLEKIRKISIDDVDLILLTGDIGKADFVRQRSFENIKRKKEGLPELKYVPKEKREEHMEIYNSTLNLLRYLSKKSSVFAIEGNVGVSTLSETKKENKKYNLHLPSTMEAIKEMKNVYLVKNKLRTFNGLRIGFLEYFVDTCWVKEFKPKDYDKSMNRAKKQTEKAKKFLKNFGSLDILVCHQPPYGYLDKVNFPGVPESWKEKHAGSKVILDYIKKYQPKYVFCGHIHEGEGKVKIGKTEVYNLGAAGHKIINI